MDSSKAPPTPVDDPLKVPSVLFSKVTASLDPRLYFELRAVERQHPEHIQLSSQSSAQSTPQSTPPTES